MNLITICFMLFLVLFYVNSEPTTKTMTIPTTKSTTTTKTTITSINITTNKIKYQNYNNRESPIVTWVIVSILVLILIICFESTICSNNIHRWGDHPILILILLIIVSPIIFIPHVLYLIIIKPLKTFIVNKIKRRVQVHIEQIDNTIEELQYENEDVENIEANEINEVNENIEDNILNYSIIDIEDTDLDSYR